MLEPNAAKYKGLGAATHRLPVLHDELRAYLSGRQPRASTCMVRRDDEVRSMAKPGSEVPLWDPASFNKGFRLKAASK